LHTPIPLIHTPPFCTFISQDNCLSTILLNLPILLSSLDVCYHFACVLMYSQIRFEDPAVQSQVASGTLWQEVLQWYREGHVMTCATPDDDNNDNDDDANAEEQRNKDDNGGGHVHSKDRCDGYAISRENSSSSRSSSSSALLSESVERLRPGQSQDKHSNGGSTTAPAATGAVGGWSGLVSGHAYAISACVEVRFEGSATF